MENKKQKNHLLRLKTVKIGTWNLSAKRLRFVGGEFWVRSACLMSIGFFNRYLPIDFDNKTKNSKYLKSGHQLLIYPDHNVQQPKKHRNS
jgi:hypothetical protein